MRVTAAALIATALAITVSDDTRAEPYPGATCPLGVNGATIGAHDSDDGVDVTLTASTDAAVDELRLRARDVAPLYGPGARRGRGHHGVHAGGEQHGLRLNDLPPVTVRVDDMPGGAWIHVLAKDPARDRGEIRRRVHQRVAEIQRSVCEWHERPTR